MANETRRPGDSIAITRAYFDSLLIEMRHLDARPPDTGIELFGEGFATPVMTAALSHMDKVRKNGMVEIATGARAAGAVMWCGMGDEEELMRITQTGAKTIKIIKPYADRDSVYKKIHAAAACGALAVGMDIDHQFDKTGAPDNVLGHPMAPVSASELADFASASALPFVVKGVLGARDAVKCAEAGVAGIVLSHHNGLIEYAVPPLMALPEVAAAVKGGGMKIFVDCGIASGADVFKALALGADAVCVGKAIMGPLAENGAAGVEETLAALTRQLAGIMARTACGTVREIEASLLRSL